MSQDFKGFLAECQGRVEDALRAACELDPSEYSEHNSKPLTATLAEALAYSTLDGGKRVRPTLVYAAAAACGANSNKPGLDQVAAATECMHCYSLVHDDLPAMDDDDLRRGRPTAHIAFDEATAILTGDALQALAFELLASAPGLSESSRLAMVNTLATASGARGMVGGQMIDLAMENSSADLTTLETLHQLKTGALIRASVRLGAQACEADPDTLAALDEYAHCIGLAFQVKDDLLDVESSTETLGKTQGADVARNKTTYPALLGLEESRQRLDQLYQRALKALEPLGDKASALSGLARFIIERNH